jgi:hypothetical protein
MSVKVNNGSVVMRRIGLSSSLQSAFNAALLTVEFESKKADLLSRI